MSNLAVIRATYSEWKMVKTRKVLVLSFEVPLEHQEAVQAALGTPMPDQETWVAIARLAEPKLLPAPADKDTPTKPARLSQIAGIISHEGGFARFCGENGHDDPVQAIYSVCGISSRRELDTNTEAAARFRNMKADYEAWLQVPA